VPCCELVVAASPSRTVSYGHFCLDPSWLHPCSPFLAPGPWRAGGDPPLVRRIWHRPCRPTQFVGAESSACSGRRDALRCGAVDVRNGCHTLRQDVRPGCHGQLGLQRCLASRSVACTAGEQHLALVQVPASRSFASQTRSGLTGGRTPQRPCPAARRRRYVLGASNSIRAPQLTNL
jgi:hypothetical protein